MAKKKANKKNTRKIDEERRAVNKMKTEFVALASHQLRTPLLTIDWYAEALLAGDIGKLKKEQENYLRQIYDVNRRLIELVEDFLNISQIDLGTFIIKPKPVDVLQIADSVFDELLPHGKGKKLKIIKDYVDDIPIINTDPRFVRIVFQNLLSNAMKYTPKYGEVSLEVRRIDDNVFIKISDTGIGIPKVQQKKVFSRLFRAKNVKQKLIEGTGLGLYIIKLVIDKLKGKIWFESEEGKGTTFFVTIPLGKKYTRRKTKKTKKAKKTKKLKKPKK